MKYPLTATPEKRATALASMGNYLDSVEAGLIPCNARCYQIIANKVTEIMDVTRDCPFVREVVAISPALIELRSNQGLAKAISIGLLEMPESLVRAIAKRG